MNNKIFKLLQILKIIKITKKKQIKTQIEVFVNHKKKLKIANFQKLRSHRVIS